VEIARTRLFLNLGDPLHLPVIIGEASCTYMAKASFDDKFQVTVNLTRIGDKGFDLSYEMSNQENQSIAGGRTVMVAYDNDDHSAIRIPKDMRKSLEIYSAL
jgi:acyl-CoA thioesterase FadM